MYAIGEKILIATHLQMFDLQSAFANAKSQALNIFGATDEGYMKNIQNYSRKTDSLMLEFKTATQISNMGGVSYVFEFLACVDRV